MEYKTIQEYLSVVEEQIRWNRARPVLSRELRQHLEDQRDAFAAAGFEDAERMAVDEMGDPVAVGTELDHIHRPKPQWGLLGMTVIMALAGGFLRVWLTCSAESGLYAFSQTKTVLALVLGIGALLGMYFLDCSRLLCRPVTVYITTLAVSILALVMSPYQGYKSYYAGYIVQIFPLVYAVWLYAWRGKGWKGFLMSLAGGIPLVLLCTLVPDLSSAVTLMLIGFILLMLAVYRDWFQISKPLAASFLVGLAVAMASGVFLRFGRSLRWQAVVHPESDPVGYGYTAEAVRNALSASQWLGTGAADFAPYPFEGYVPDWSRNFLLTTVVYKLGWLPFLLLVLAMTALVVWMLGKWSRNKAGEMLVLSAALIFLFRIAFSVMMNMGFVLFPFGFPLLTGNLQSIVDMGITGAALSVFRSGSILREYTPEKTLDTDVYIAGAEK